MKFWNKDKRVRQTHWTKVEISYPEVQTILSIMRENKTIPTRDNIKYWCQQQKSTGKFYNYYASETWWFEREDDAVWFALKWK